MKTKLNYIVIIPSIICFLMMVIRNPYSNWAPVSIWLAAVVLTINNIINTSTLSSKMKRSNPVLFKANSFGYLLSKSALADKSLVEELKNDEKEILLEIQMTGKYVMICFVLFGLSGLLTVLLSQK